MGKDARTNFALDAHMKQAIKELAHDMHISESELQRRLMEKGFDAMGFGKPPVAAESSAVPTGEAPCPHGCDAATPFAARQREHYGVRHGVGEWRIEHELAPRYRAMIAARGTDEGPHDYIARFWAHPSLQPHFARDTELACGFEPFVAKRD